MNTNFIHKITIFFFYVININELLAFHNSLNIHKKINWWGLGSKYNDAPAFGWYTITFMIFLSVILYICYIYLSRFFYQRSISIEKNIIKIKQLKEMAQTKLNKRIKKIDSLELEIQRILNDFNKKNDDQKKHSIYNIKSHKEFIKNNMENIIVQYLKQFKMDIKESIVNHIIYEVIKKVKYKNSRDIDEKHILKNLYNLEISL